MTNSQYPISNETLNPNSPLRFRVWSFIGHWALGFGVLLLLFFALPSSAEAANRYWVGGTDGANTNDTANWASADPASCTGGGASVPTTTDVAIFDADCDNGATINANFSAQKLEMKSGYIGTVTQATTITVTLDPGTSGDALVIAGGTFTGGDAAIDINDGNFNQSGGTFTNSSGNMTVERNFTVSGGTFTNTGKTVTFDGVTPDNSVITCSGTLGGTVVINKTFQNDNNHTSSLSSGCSISLGANPTTSIPSNKTGPGQDGTFTNNGTITVDSGTWTIAAQNDTTFINNGTITHNGTGWDINFTHFTNNSGATITYAGTSITINNNFTQSGTFDLTGKTVTFDGASQNSVITCSGTLGGTVVFSKSDSDSNAQAYSLASGCSISAGASPTWTFDNSGTFTNNGTITVDSGTWTLSSPGGTSGLVNAGTITHNGNGWDFNSSAALTNNSGATITYAGTAITINGNFTQNGTFDLTGKTVTFDGTTGASTLTCGATIGGLTINKTSTGTTVLGGNCTVSGNFTRTDGAFSNPASAYILTVQGDFSMSTTDTFGGANLTLTMGGGSNQTITQNAGSVAGPFKIDKSGGTASLSTNFTTSNGTSAEVCTVVEGTFDINGKTFTCDSTFTVEDGGTLERFGTSGESLTSPTLNSGSTVTYTGDGDSLADTVTVTTMAATYHHLTINSTDGATDTFNIAATLDINGNFTNTAGTVTASGNAITVAGNWSNSGTYTHGNNTVTLDGTNQTLAGSTTFYNLTKSVTSAATLTFTASTTQTIANILTLNGASGQLLSLRSSATPTQWNINPQGTRTLSYLDVKDSNNTNATAVVCSNNCTDSGNNTNWSFPLQGIVYSNEGTTAFGSGTTIAVSLNGAAATTTTTNASGRYNFNGLTINDGDIIAVWIDTGVERGVTVTKVSGLGTLGALHIYQNRLIARAEGAGTLTNANLDTADNSGDADIAALYSVSGGALTSNAGYELLIWTGETFAPGAAVTGDDIDINGTFTMGANSVTMTGTWDATGGAFTSSGTVTMSGTSTETITSNGQSFSSLTISGNGGHYNSQDALRVTGALTISTGATLDVNGSNFNNTSGTFSNDGTLRAQGSETFTGFTNDTNSGTTLFDGTGTYSSLAGLTSFYNLTFNGTGATWTQAAAIDANGLLTLTAGTLDASSSNYGATVAGGWTDTGAGAYTERSGTVTFDGTGTINANEAFNSVTVNGTGITVSLGAALDVNGTLTITAGTLDVTTNNYGLTVATNWSNSGTFTARSGTVTFDGTNQTISGSTAFYNFTKVESANDATDETLTFAASATQTITNVWTLDGRDADDQINIVSSSPGTQWKVDPQGTRTLDFITITDSNNINASTVLCSNDCTNGGGNSGWAFPITVTVYTDEGTTGIGANKTVAVSVGGGTKATADTNSSSIASFTTVAVSSGDVVSMWIDDETENGMTVSITNGTTLGFTIYQNRLILQHETGSQVTNTNLSTADDSGDDDIAAIYTVSSGAVTVAAGLELLVNTSDVYKPGGAVTFEDIDINGTLTMEANAVTVSGSWDATGGAFSGTGSQTVTFNATAAETVKSNGSCFQNVTYSLGTSGTLTNSDTLCINGTQTVQAAGSGSSSSDTTAPTISDIAVTAGETKATISWKTNESADSAVDYGASASLGTSASDTSQTVWHAMTLTGLTANTTYHYKVTSKDASNNSSSSEVNTFTTLQSGSTSDTSAPTISGISTSSITSSGATVTWTTSENTIGYVNYGEATAYNRGSSPGNNTYGTSKTVTLTGLSPATTYHFQITAIDQAGNVGTSADQTLTTAAEEEEVQAAEVFQETSTQVGSDPPKLTSEAPAVVNITGSSATVQWQTDKPSTSVVYYRELGSTANPTQLGSVSFVTEHSVKLAGLLDSTAYEYSVESVNAEGSKVRSKRYQFTTSLPGITDVTVQEITDTCASFVYVTDSPTATQLELTNLATGETLEVKRDDITLQHRIPLCELDSETEYQAVVIVRSPTGSESRSLAYIFQTRPDTADPIISQIETRSALVEGGDDVVQTIIIWKTNEAATSQVVYNEGLTRGGDFQFKTDVNEADFVTDHVIVLATLKPSTVYEFYVASRDRADHEVKSEPRVLLTPARRVSALDLIIANLEDTFGWVRNLPLAR